MKERNNLQQDNEEKKLIEGVDYYFDEDLMVLTAHFLLKRGYCCGNGCRNCPYLTDQELK